MGQSCNLSNLTVSTNMGPGVTSAAFTVQTGTPVFNLNSVSGMTDSALSCTVTGSATQCTSTGSVPVTAGQFITVKLFLSNATTPSSFFGYWAIGCQ
jgi:hypothetical protein